MVNCDDKQCDLGKGVPILVTTDWCGYSRQAHELLKYYNTKSESVHVFDGDNADTKLPQELVDEVRGFPAVILCAKGEAPSAKTCTIGYGPRLAVESVLEYEGRGAVQM